MTGLSKRLDGFPKARAIALLGFMALTAVSLVTASVELGIKALGMKQGVIGAISTLAVHAAYLKSFGRANNALNTMGWIYAHKRMMVWCSTSFPRVG